MLVMSTKGKAFRKLRSAPEGNGMEAWRLMNVEWEPRQQQRYAALLTNIIRAGFPEPSTASIETWEEHVK